MIAGKNWCWLKMVPPGKEESFIGRKKWVKIFRRQDNASWKYFGRIVWSLAIFIASTWCRALSTYWLASSFRREVCFWTNRCPDDRLSSQYWRMKIDEIQLLVHCMLNACWLTGWGTIVKIGWLCFMEVLLESSPLAAGMSGLWLHSVWWMECG